MANIFSVCYCGAMGNGRGHLCGQLLCQGLSTEGNNRLVVTSDACGANGDFAKIEN